MSVLLLLQPEPDCRMLKPPSEREKHMDKNIYARDAQLRAISVYTRRPDRAQVMHRGFATVRDGLTCTYEQDGHRVTIDMPAAIGGDNQGPSPGYFGRAAICSCLAIGIKMMATREDLRIDEVEVDLEQDWDNRGILAVGGTSPTPLGTRITVAISSPEQREKVNDLIARAITTDPWLLAFRDAQPVTTRISINEGLE